MAKAKNSTLDFSGLTDDQLVSLIREALEEAASRTLACKTAAEAVFFDEAEKARLAQEATEREIDRLKREEAEQIARDAAEKVRLQKAAETERAKEKKVSETWEYKDCVGQQISAILKPTRTIQLSVWSKKDKRIYIGGGFDDNDVKFFCTGNSSEKAKALYIFTSADIGLTEEELPAAKESLLPILEDVCKRWNAIYINVPKFEEKEVSQ
jgi:hypothetical protein